MAAVTGVWFIVVMLCHALVTASDISINPGTSPYGPPILMYNWTVVDWDWSNAPFTRQQAIDSGVFIPTNCLISGIKVYQGVTYVTVPRWREGVPATLNTVVPNPNPTPGSDPFVLRAFPSWTMNGSPLANGVTGQNHSAFQYVQSMEIDNTGWMWIVDVGRLNFLSLIGSNATINGPPKLVIYDLINAAIVRIFVFPDDVLPYSTSFLNDICVDRTSGFAYMSDTAAGPSGMDGAVVVYNFNTNTARRYVGQSTRSEAPNVPIIIANVTYAINSATNGIALSVDRQTFYYCPLRGLNLHSLPTSALQNFVLTDAELDAQVTTYGQRMSQSGGLAIDTNGVLWMGLLSEIGMGSWDTAKPFATSQNAVFINEPLINWMDSFAFDHSDHSLVWTSNRFNLYYTNKMDWTGASGTNIRIFKLPIGADSYLTNQPPPSAAQPQQCTACSNAAAVGWAVGIVIGLLTGGGVMFILIRRGVVTDERRLKHRTDGIDYVEANG